jgi:hypothetical protein
MYTEKYILFLFYFIFYFNLFKNKFISFNRHLGHTNSYKYKSQIFQIITILFKIHHILQFIFIKHKRQAVIGKVIITPMCQLNY